MAERPPLFQFVILSMLLHLLLIVLIGDANRSAARRGDGFWGSLDVSLRGLAPDPGMGSRLAPGVDTSPRGAVTARPPQGASDAPTAGRSEPRVLEHPTPEQSNDIHRVPAEPLPPAQEAESIPAAPSFEVVPPMNLTAPQEIDKPLSPSPMPLLKVEPQPRPAAERASPVKPFTPPPLERMAPPKIERELAPRVETFPREVPIAPAPLDRIAPRQAERDLAPPVVVTPRERPMTPANIESVAPQRIERELAPPIEVAPREQPIAPEALERIAPARIERELTTPPAVAPPVAPAMPAPIERIAPTQRSPELAAPVAVPRSVEPATILPGVEREAAPRAPASSRDAPKEAPAAVASPPGASPPRLRFGAPQPDEDIFKPRRDVVVPSTEPGGAPRIDREALHARVREIERETTPSRALVEVELPQLERKIANSFDKAAKPDCRTAYAGLGLLAIPALLASAIADGGCKW